MFEDAPMTCLDLYIMIFTGDYGWNTVLSLILSLVSLGVFAYKASSGDQKDSYILMKQRCICKIFNIVYLPWLYGDFIARVICPIMLFSIKKYRPYSLITVAATNIIWQTLLVFIVKDISLSQMIDNWKKFNKFSGGSSRIENKNTIPKKSFFYNGSNKFAILAVILLGPVSGVTFIENISYSTENTLILLFDAIIKYSMAITCVVFYFNINNEGIYNFNDVFMIHDSSNDGVWYDNNGKLDYINGIKIIWNDNTLIWTYIGLFGTCIGTILFIIILMSELLETWHFDYTSWNKDIIQHFDRLEKLKKMVKAFDTDETLDQLALRYHDVEILSNAFDEVIHTKHENVIKRLEAS